MGPDLDHWLPEHMVRIAHSEHSRAPVEALWSAAQSLHLQETGLLGRLIRWRIPGTPPTISFDRLFREPPFLVLEDGPTSLVSGLVGRIWTLRRDYPRLREPAEFEDWDARGTARVLFAHWAQAAPGGGSVLRSEARVQALGAQGRLGLAAVRPLISGFQHLITSEALELAARRAQASGTLR